MHRRHYRYKVAAPVKKREATGQCVVSGVRIVPSQFKEHFGNALDSCARLVLLNVELSMDAMEKLLTNIQSSRTIVDLELEHVTILADDDIGENPNPMATFIDPYGPKRPFDLGLKCLTIRGNVSSTSRTLDQSAWLRFMCQISSGKLERIHIVVRPQLDYDAERLLYENKNTLRSFTSSYEMSNQAPLVAWLTCSPQVECLDVKTDFSRVEHMQELIRAIQTTSPRHLALGIRMGYERSLAILNLVCQPTIPLQSLTLRGQRGVIAISWDNLRRIAYYLPDAPNLKRLELIDLLPPSHHTPAEYESVRKLLTSLTTLTTLYVPSLVAHPLVRLSERWRDYIVIRTLSIPIFCPRFHRTHWLNRDLLRRLTEALF
jgi:hypothetical protein